MHKKRILAVTVAFFSATVFFGCGNTEKKISLDPSNPVSIKVWHYYTGTQQAAFEELVEEFNATTGREQGVYVEGYSQGSVADLEKAITNAVNGVVGAEALPDIFSSYADTAYSAQQKEKLIDLTAYFSEEELAQYVDSYIEEGYFNNDGALYLFPVAKSTEIMMLNTTDWEPFAEATGSTLEELATTEGVTEVSKRYYEWTDSLTPDIPDDGKAFYGRDAMANYFIIGMKQMGTEIFSVENGNVKIQADKELIRRLWDNYYIPIIYGYYGAYGRFRSDDIKTGDILAFTGSSTSSMYFPDKVEKDGESYDIDYVVLPAPIMENGENYMVQQGAGMAVTKSNEQREYAACLFLKWLAQAENNLKFICDAAYFPVRKDANNVETLDKVIKEENIEINPKAYDSIVSVLGNYENIQFYATNNFENGYSARNILEYNLSDKAAADKDMIDELVEEGMERSEAIALYDSDEEFDKWYEAFVDALSEAAFQ